MPFTGPNGDWEPGWVAEHYAEELELKSAEEEQAENVLKDHLRSIGERFNKLKLLQHRGHNWFEFHNPTTGNHWVLDANPSHGINHWIITRSV